MKKLLLPLLSILLLTACKKDKLDSVKFQNDRESYSISKNSVLNSTLATHTINVSGTIAEQIFQFAVTPNGIMVTGRNTWTGNLSGNGHVHIFSSQIIDPYNGIDIISKRWLYTPHGNLFFDEIGTHHGEIISVISTVTGGTGIYKKAQGQLTLNGISSEAGNQFTYTGNIVLSN